MNPEGIESRSASTARLIGFPGCSRPNTASEDITRMP